MIIYFYLQINSGSSRMAFEERSDLCDKKAFQYDANRPLADGFTDYIITGRNEVVAKVMFLQVCVCPHGGRVSASVHAGMPPPTRQTPPGPGRHPPRTRQTPPPRDQADTPQTRQTPPLGSRLQHTVYERPVRILLECILVNCMKFEHV